MLFVLITAQLYNITHNKSKILDNFFSKNLRHLRQQKGLSQDDLCLKIGCSKSALSQYERGSSEPTLHVIDSIVRYFGVDFDSLTHKDLETQPIVEEAKPSYNTEFDRLRFENETLRQALREIGKGMKH